MRGLRLQILGTLIRVPAARAAVRRLRPLRSHGAAGAWQPPTWSRRPGLLDARHPATWAGRRDDAGGNVATHRGSREARTNGSRWFTGAARRTRLREADPSRSKSEQ